MKLYEIPQESKLLIETRRSPDGELFTFHHIDGMYSLCTADEDGKYLHLSASAPLKKEKDYYIINPLLTRLPRQKE